MDSWLSLRHLMSGARRIIDRLLVVRLEKKRSSSWQFQESFGSCESLRGLNLVRPWIRTSSTAGSCAGRRSCSSILVRLRVECAAHDDMCDSLHPRTLDFWNKIWKDLRTSSFIIRLLSDAMRQCAVNGELSHIPMDTTIKNTRIRRQNQPTSDALCLKRLSNGVYQPFWEPLVHAQVSIMFITRLLRKALQHCQAYDPMEFHCKVVSVSTDQPWWTSLRGLWLSIPCETLRTRRETTRGSYAFYRTDSTNEMIRTRMTSDSPVYSGLEQLPKVSIHIRAAVSVNSDMTEVAAERVVADLGREHSLGKPSEVRAKPLSHNQHAAGLTLNVTATSVDRRWGSDCGTPPADPRRVQWYFKNQRIRHRQPAPMTALVSSGTFAKEPFHKEINDRLRTSMIMFSGVWLFFNTII